MVMSNLGNQRKIGYIVSWIGDAFNIDCLGILIDYCCKSFRCLLSNKLDTNAVVFERDLELVVCAAIDKRTALKRVRLVSPVQGTVAVLCYDVIPGLT